MCGKSRPTGIRSSGRTARSELLYRLSYSGPYISSLSSFIFKRQNGPCTYNNETLYWNHCCSGKAKSITYFCVCVNARVCAHECVWVWVLCTVSGACSLTYLVCKANAPYSLLPLWLQHVFRYYLTNGTIFVKKLPNIKSVWVFSVTFIWDINSSCEIQGIYFNINNKNNK